MSLTKTQQAGFTLLEVMIALVIFSIGLLGLAGMQAAGIRNNQVSFSRTVAIQLANDMADRIRNNNDPTINYETIAPGTADCVNGPCSGAELAGFDRTEWNTAINNPPSVTIKNAASPLRSGAGFITRMNTVSGITFYRVSVTWDESDGGASTAAADATECGPPVAAGKVCISIDVYL